MSNAVSEARDLIEGRLRELDAERGHLERALSELTGNGHGAGAGAARRRPGRPRGSGTKRRRRGTQRGKRQEQFLSLVGEQPGITPKQVTETLGISANHAYTLARTLEQRGLVKRSGGKISLTAAAKAASADTSDAAAETAAATLEEAAAS